MLLAPGLVPGIPAYSVKVHAKFPGQDPAIKGVLLLHDLATGALLGLLKSSHLTALRTGLAGALGAEALARPDARTVAIVGAGAQGRSQLSALRLVRPVDRVQVFDPSPETVSRFAADPCCTDLDVHRSATMEAALGGADIIVTATWAREPFLFRRHLRPGLHITTLGTDQPGKCEVAADVAARRGVGQASVALAWLHRHPVVVAPIVGALKAEHIDDAVTALSITLTDDEIARLEASYTPREDGQGVSDPAVLTRGMEAATGFRMSRS